MNAPIIDDFTTLRWVGDVDGQLELLDQTALPDEVRYLACRDVETLFEAIRSLRVRGAPAIGIAAAYGVCLGLQTAVDLNEQDFFFRLDETVRRLAESRPTAVNLFWALQRMQALARNLRGTYSLDGIRSQMLDEARAIEAEDRAMCRSIGRHGAALLADGDGVLTHCNAGGLATSGYGTALAVFYSAHEQGKRLRVFVDETRPLLQGARLTAWELRQRGLDVTLLCDNAAAALLRTGRVRAVVVGADRIAANGDAANKIGTYGLALAATAHGVPFYIAAPSSTFDLALSDGDAIPIEQRDGREVTHGFGRATAPDGVAVFNPAFDVTPARLIAGIICEHGVIRPVDAASIHRMLTGGR
jgi:methylthioribose-1-phosphate isomerase